MEIAATNNTESILRNSFDRFPDVPRAVLFGSAASGRMRGRPCRYECIQRADFYQALTKGRIVVSRKLGSVTALYEGSSLFW